MRHARTNALRKRVEGHARTSSMRERVRGHAPSVLHVLALALGFFGLPAWSDPTPAAAQGFHAVDSPMPRGEYLAHLGDCVACHSKHGGVPFAGGFPMPTPFGTLYSPNITPDRATGIGAWTSTEFYQMLHTGRSRDGTLLYPAMPFPAYTQVTREDSDALFEYLMSLKPVNQPNRQNELRFPYNNRSLMFGWRVLYFKEGTFVPVKGRSAQFNRGAYLVQGQRRSVRCRSHHRVPRSVCLQGVDACRQSPGYSRYRR